MNIYDVSKIILPIKFSFIFFQNLKLKLLVNDNNKILLLPMFNNYYDHINFNIFRGF